MSASTTPAGTSSYVNDADGSVGTILIDPALPNSDGYTITEKTAPTGYLLGTATTAGPYVTRSVQSDSFDFAGNQRADGRRLRGGPCQGK